MFKYSVQLFWSEEDSEYVATVPEFPHISALADTPEEAVREGVGVTETVLDMLKEQGRTPPEPKVLSGYSGEIRIRMPRTLHQRLAGRARMESVSLNTLMVSLLAEGVGWLEGSSTAELKTRRQRSRWPQLEPEA